MEQMGSSYVEKTILGAGGQGGRLTNSPPAKRPGSDIEYNLSSLLTIQQLAQRLSVKVRTVRSWIYKRTIPFTSLGRRIYIHTEVIERLLNSNAIPALRRSGSPDSKPIGQGGAEASKGVA